MSDQVRELVPAALVGQRIDRVVAMLTGLSRAEVTELVAAGGVRVGGKAVTTRSRRVDEGEVIEVDVTRPQPAGLEPDPSVPFAVVLEDDDVVVVDKPAGVVVHPGGGQHHGTLVQGLLARYPEVADVGQPDRPGIVHRLDKGTSGLLVVARSAAAYAGLVQQLQRRTVDRRYIALVWGHVVAPAGMVDAPVGRAPSDPTRMAVAAAGREARTRYEVLERFHRPSHLTLVECRLETGRTHQIRVHLAAIGHPVVGDGRYGGERRSFPCPRPFLHACRLEFDHPVTGEAVVCSSALPDDLADVRARLS